MRRAATGQPLAAPPAPAPPPPPKPRPPKPPRPPVKHPEGPAGTIERAVAATFPLESFGPVAWMQSPTARSLAEATFDSDTVTVVGRLMVCAAPVTGCRVTEVPFTAVTLPAAKAGRGWPGAGVRRGSARGVAFGFGAPLAPGGRLPRPALQAPFTGWPRRTLEATTVPLASLVPVAITQLPGTTSARTPVLVWVMVVVLV